MQLEIPFVELNVNAIISETIKPVTVDGILPFIFDINVYKRVNYSNNFSKIWDDFLELRKCKNVIFKNSMADKAKELFK